MNEKKAQRRLASGKGEEDAVARAAGGHAGEKGEEPDKF